MWDLDLVCKLITNVNNRDKFLKITQYLLKLYLLKYRGKETDTIKAMKALASTLSISRLVYRLGDWLVPLNDELLAAITLLRQGKFKDILDLNIIEALFSFLNAILDDMICLNKSTKGLWPKVSTTQMDWCDLWSSKLWLYTIAINLHFQRKKLRKGYSKDAVLAIGKLVCDAIFCLYDIYGWNTGKEIPILAGLGAASIGIYRAALKNSA